MIKLKFPLIFNTNLEIQGQDGTRLLKVLGSGLDAAELGNWATKALNSAPELQSFVDSLRPGDILDRGAGNRLIVIPLQEFEEGRRCKDIVEAQAKIVKTPGFPDTPKPKRKGNPNWFKGMKAQNKKPIREVNDGEKETEKTL